VKLLVLNCTHHPAMTAGYLPLLLLLVLLLLLLLLLLLAD
jgi:hypothetical protein